MKALITGITGQDGSYLAEFLLKKNYQVIGLVSRKNNFNDDNIKQIKKSLILEEGDLVNEKSLERIIKKHKPDEIYNLGGLTFVPYSWEDPIMAFDVNALGTARLLNLMRKFLPKAKFYQASSAKIFGNPSFGPQDEKTPLKPETPYAVSKAAAHFLVQNFRRHFHLFAVSGILYNHESERRGVEFVSRKITLTAAKIKLKLEKKLYLGNLEAKEDWGYAADYVEAMWLMLQQKEAEDFIIGTGETHSVKEICQIAFGYLNLDWKKYVISKKNLFRQEEENNFYANYEKARKKLGWHPKTDFKTMIIKMVENDLKLLKEKKI